MIVNNFSLTISEMPHSCYSYNYNPTTIVSTLNIIKTIKNNIFNKSKICLIDSPTSVEHK